MSALRSRECIDIFDDFLPEDGGDGFSACYSNQMNRVEEAMWCLICRKEGKLYAVDGERLHWQSLSGNHRPALELGPLAVPILISKEMLERGESELMAPRKGHKRTTRTWGGCGESRKRQQQ